MQLFEYAQAESPAAAIAAGAKAKTAQQGATIRFLAGGTTLYDLMKLDVETPEQLVDLKQLKLAAIDPMADGGLRIGASAKNSDLANHELVKTLYPVLSEAILAGASTQLRNMATTAGNLLQRTRCVYFRDIDHPCNKREPGSGCPAIDGHNRTLAILGGSEQCIATNPSDMNVALAALEATIHITGTKGERAVPIAEFYTLPGKTPERENILEPGDLITHVTLPASPVGAKSFYLKLRDRASYEFALVSAAVIGVVKDQKLAHIRVAFGGIGTVPWRSKEAEQVLLQQAPTVENFRKAAEAALRDAKPQSENGFKVELAKRCLVEALKAISA